VNDAVARAAAAATLGLRGRLTPAERARLLSDLHDADPRVRAAATGALVRAVPDDAGRAWEDAANDGDAAVRRRAAELAPALGQPALAVVRLIALLRDGDVTVVEAGAWALGELGGDAVTGGAVDALVDVAQHHREPLGREAAVAALGALGDPRALDAILHACADRPPVRRRAVLALAAFDGPLVDAAIAAALEDRDWQVRQAAEDLVDAHRRGPSAT
jgi:HEAT repeat protein